MADFFIELTKDPIMIDKNVYEEVVEEGIKRGYSDANQISAILQTHNIPIIPVDIHADLYKFRDPGETSCFLLARKEGVCITCDQRATKKMALYGVLGIQLDNFFYQQYLNENITRNKILEVLDKLEGVNATTPERKLVFLKSIFMHKEEKKNE
ncbi:MAG TPA: hypothetical protein VMV49_01885 [Candidatus Deferrimicrobium sp.]|nr:hypothetical protein [Candidatus Deferrimicrobium sp.]